MAPLLFPNAPVNGDKYPTPPVAGQPVYIYDGEKWKSNTNPPSTVTVSDTPPLGAVDGQMWWESDSGLLYIMYNDGSSRQWVIAAPQPDFSAFVAKAGDTLTGPLIAAADPTALLGVATKQYVDIRTPTRYSLAGVRSVDVTVPTGAVMARIIGMLFPLTATPAYLTLQLSVSPGIFKGAAGDYKLDGFDHAVPGTAVGSTQNSAAYGAMLLTSASTSTVVPMSFNTTLGLRRPNTGALFAAHSYGMGWGTDLRTAFYHNYLTPAAAGSALSVLAFRMTNTTGENWAAESYFVVEWL